MTLDNASEVKLNQVVAYLSEKSDKRLWARLYQKIIFLLELEFYKKHQRALHRSNFKSYFFGPFSIDIAQALENSNKIEIPKYVKNKVDEILKQYDLKEFDNKHQEKAFKKIIDYIHSLYIYQITPFESDFDFSFYDFKDLFSVVDSELDGISLEQEKYENAKIKLESKKYE